MPIQLLIYKTAVPINLARHGDCSVETRSDYAFSSEVNSVPLMAVEFPQASSEYAVVFAGTETEVMPAVILGVRGSENLFLSAENAWEGKYIPAFLRRYPFVFTREADRFVLCIDEEAPGFNREGRGERLFAADGNPSAYVDNVLKFLQEFQAQFLNFFNHPQFVAGRVNDVSSATLVSVTGGSVTNALRADNANFNHSIYSAGGRNTPFPVLAFE